MTWQRATTPDPADPLRDLDATHPLRERPGISGSWVRYQRGATVVLAWRAEWPAPSDSLSALREAT